MPEWLGVVAAVVSACAAGALFGYRRGVTDGRHRGWLDGFESCRRIYEAGRRFRG
jgi:hypothetical protein